MNDLVDIEKYPLDCPSSNQYKLLVEKSRAEIAADGLTTLTGFIWPEIAQGAADALKSVLTSESYRHARSHNVYFEDSVPGLADNHPALRKLETINHVLCADQLVDNPVTRLYEWPPFAAFLAAVMGKESLYTMRDPLARVNIQASRDGEKLSWHFDRSEFTTTLLLQAPHHGGELEYRKDLRSASDPNYAGVAKVLSGQDSVVKQLALKPGALNIFHGVNTLHRVAPVQGERERIVSIFAFFDRPGVLFTEKEQLGFYGRSAGV